MQCNYQKNSPLFPFLFFRNKMSNGNIARKNPFVTDIITIDSISSFSKLSLIEPSPYWCNLTFFFFLIIKNSTFQQFWQAWNIFSKLKIKLYCTLYPYKIFQSSKLNDKIKRLKNQQADNEHTWATYTDVKLAQVTPTIADCYPSQPGVVFPKLRQ